MSEYAGEPGYLTQVTIRAVLDELWKGRPLAPPRPGYSGRRQPFGMIAMPPPRPPEWTVEAGGWRLVIEDGAIRGLEQLC